MRDLQLFLKRLRKNADRPKDDTIRFYGCGEYGEALSRPHYHLCLFNYRPTDLIPYSKNAQGDVLYTSEQLKALWQNGYTVTGEVTFQSAGYISRYILKKINGAMADQHYQNVDPHTGEIHALLPEFTTMSRRAGIGSPWLKLNKTEVYDYEELILNGKRKKIPLNYDRQFEQMDPDRFEIIKTKRKRAARKHASNNTSNRLRVREAVQKAKIANLKRGL